MLLKRDSDKRVVIFDPEKGEDRIFISLNLADLEIVLFMLLSLEILPEIEQEKPLFFKKSLWIDHLTRAYNKENFGDALNPIKINWKVNPNY